MYTMLTIMFIVALGMAAVTIWQDVTILKMAKDVKEFFKLDEFVEEEKTKKDE